MITHHINALQVLVGLVSGFVLGIAADCTLITLRPGVRRSTASVVDYLRIMVFWFSTSSSDVAHVVADVVFPDDDGD